MTPGTRPFATLELALTAVVEDPETGEGDAKTAKTGAVVDEQFERAESVERQKKIAVVGSRLAFTVPDKVTPDTLIEDEVVVALGASYVVKLLIEPVTLASYVLPASIA